MRRPEDREAHERPAHEAGRSHTCHSCVMGPCVCADAPDRAPCASFFCTRKPAH